MAPTEARLHPLFDSEYVDEDAREDEEHASPDVDGDALPARVFELADGEREGVRGECQDAVCAPRFSTLAR